MVSENRYIPAQSRGASFSAALLINGALVTGLIFAAPQMIPKLKPHDFEATHIPLPVAPPPPKPKRVIEVKEKTLTAPVPNAPDPIVDLSPNHSVRTGSDLTLPDPYIGGMANPGPMAEPAPPPLPPLVGAKQDMRFARDFQPPYPAAELRAARDGRVSVRVLIGVDGRVKAVEQLSATSPAFFDATRRQALAKWRFTPARRGGVPEESWMVLSVRFEIASQ